METIKSIVDKLNAQKSRADFRSELEKVFFTECWNTQDAINNLEDEFGIRQEWNSKFIRDIGSLLWYFKYESFDQ